MLGKYICVMFVFFPVLSLFLGGLAWLRYGIDIPWFDDWRGYMDGNIHSLSLDYLFRSVNDTLAPVGFALDALAQRYLGGNSIAYQFISMISVLGGLMWLQWRLLIQSLQDKLQASVCFLLVIFMLQPDSYWGWENLAYHQALPLVFILMAINLIVFSEKSIKFIGPLIFILGVFAGFTYISGAVGVLVCSVTMMALSYYLFSGEKSINFRQKSLWFLAAGLTSSTPQIYFSIIKARGTHTGVPLALPNSLDFWFFYMGKIGRSLLLLQERSLFSFGVTVVVVVVSLVVGWILLKWARKNQSYSLRDKNLIIVYISLGVVIFVYLGMVSAGRANFRPENIKNPLDVYSYGFYRFHYFWATLFWPWLIAGLIFLAKEKIFISNKKLSYYLFAIASLFFIFSVKNSAFSHFEFQKNTADVREIAAKCLLDSVQRGPEVHCQGLTPPRGEEDIPNSFPGYMYAYKTNASFVRNFPLLFTNDHSGADEVIFDETQGGSEKNIENLKYLSPGHYFSRGIDPQLKFDIDSKDMLNKCIIFDVVVDMSVEKDARVQIFYDIPGDKKFSEKNSKTLNIKTSGNSLQSLNFRLESAIGFNGGLRFDPVDSPQKIHLKKIRGRCRMANN